MADDEADRPDGGRAHTNGRITGVQAVRLAKEQLAELTGHEADSASALTRTDDGWQVRVEMIELERIPPTTNVMGSYEVELDGEGNLVEYGRVRRYHSGQVDEDEG
jgi:hypothetical protein